MTVPVFLHRPLPSEADIVAIRMTRRQVASRFSASLTVVVRVAETSPPSEGRFIAIQSCRRVLPDQSLRIAVVAGAGAAPAALAGVARQRDSCLDIVVPARWTDAAVHLRAIGARREDDLADLREWLGSYNGVLPDRFAGWSGWSAADQFAAAILALRSLPDVDPVLLDRLDEWRRHDKRLWEAHANGNAKMVAGQQDVRRQLAAWLCSRTASIVLGSGSGLEDSALSAAIGVDGGRADLGTLCDTGAPEDLIATIESAARVRAIPVALVERPPAAHHACGEPLVESDQRLAWCPGCETMVDRDHNAAILLLRSRALTQ